MTTPTKDNALVFVGQIMTAYRAAMKVEGDALRAAIDCGKYLNLAKENVKAAKGKWEAWRKKNCPEISQQTASLYMRLDENKEKIAGAKTIRDADMILRKPRDDDDDETDSEDDETNNALLVGDECEEVTALRARESASLDLVSLLKNVGPDEVALAIKQADWGMEEIRKLISILTTRASVTQSPPPRPLQPSATPSVRPS